jgi:hypothetical protein
MPRQIYAPGYRVLVKTAITRALRQVFDNFYSGDPLLQNMSIDSSYPLKKPDYSNMIIVWFRPARVENAGVGSIEYLYDSQGVLRPFLHSRFEGRIELEVLAMRPSDLDQIVDAVMEVLRFGSLETQTNQFFDTSYGYAADNTAQLMMNTDIIYDSGDEMIDAPWGTERGNNMIFRTKLSFELHGAYYSVDLATEGASPITEVDVYPYLEGTDKPDGRFSVNEWSDAEHREDAGLVWSTALVHAVTEQGTP